MAKGNHTNAYATVLPVQDGLENFAYKQADLDFKRQEERRREEDHVALKNKREQEKIDKLANFTNLKGSDTGYNHFDEAVADAASQANDKIYELSKVYNDTSKTEAERVKAKAQMNYLTNNFTDQISKLSKTYKDTHAAYYGAKAKGETWANESFETFTRNGLPGLKLQLNDDLKYDIYAKDLDGDGVLDVTSAEEFAQLTPENVVIPVINIDKLVESRSKSLEPTVNQLYDPDDPYMKTKETDFSDSYLDQEVNAILTPTALNSERIRMGLKMEAFTPEVQAQLKERVKMGLKARIEKLGTEETYNYADENADRSRGLSASKHRDNLEHKKNVLEQKKTKGAANGKINVEDLKVSHKTTGTVYFDSSAKKDEEGKFVDKQQAFKVPVDSEVVPIPNGGISIVMGNSTEIADHAYIHPDGKGMTIIGKRHDKKKNTTIGFEYNTMQDPAQVNRFITKGFDGIKDHNEFISKINNKELKFN